jgi:hypothetical protein
VGDHAQGRAQRGVFRRAQGAHSIPQRAGDPRAWQTYTPLLGEHLDRFAVRYRCFAGQTPTPIVSGGGKPESRRIRRAPRATWSRAHLFETMDWANSHWSEAGPYQLFAVTEFSVEPSHTAEFDAAREKMSQIAIEQGWASDDHVWLWANSIGGSPRHSIIVPHRNFASLDNAGETFPQFLANKLGSAEAAEELMGRFRAATTGSDFQIWEYQAELSMPESD